MAFTIDLPNGSTLDLGDPLELFQAFKAMAQLTRDQDSSYAQLFYVPQLDDAEPLPREDWAQIQAQAEQFLDIYDSQLSDHAQWLLGQLTTAQYKAARQWTTALGSSAGLVASDRLLRKSTVTKRSAVDRMARAFERVVQREVEAAIAALRGRATDEAIAAALLSVKAPGDLDDATGLSRFPTDLAPATRRLRQIYGRSGASAAESLGSLGIDVSFSMRNPRAIQWTVSHGSRMITNVTDATRDAIQNLVAQGIDRGRPVRDTARLIRTTLGLTSRDADAAVAFRDQLLATGLDSDVIDRRVSKYVEAKVAQRAEVIARTESLAALNAGQAEAWAQAADDGLLDRTKTRRRWVTTLDERTDLEHCEPMDGQEVGLDEPFTTGAGEAVMAPPVHPQCRCRVSLRFL